VSAPGTDAPVADNNGSQPDQQTTPDPWTQTLEGVDEVYRPHVEQAINPLREQFGPRLELADRLEPLSDYADDLLALHGMADEEGNSLEDILGVASMLHNLDPENPDAPANKAFADWFYEVGDALGLLDPEGGNGQDGGEEDDEGELDVGGDDITEMRGLIEQLQGRASRPRLVRNGPRRRRASRPSSRRSAVSSRRRSTSTGWAARTARTARRSRPRSSSSPTTTRTTTRGPMPR
jgi:hypothetical protein